jgi:hypothetical protein
VYAFLSHPGGGPKGRKEDHRFTEEPTVKKRSGAPGDNRKKSGARKTDTAFVTEEEIIQRVVPVTPRILRNLCRKGSIPFIKVSQKVYLFDEAEVRAALHEGSHQTRQKLKFNAFQTRLGDEAKPGQPEVTIRLPERIIDALHTEVEEGTMNQFIEDAIDKALDTQRWRVEMKVALESRETVDFNLTP